MDVLSSLNSTFPECIGGNPDLFPELRRKSTIIHQPVMEPVNSISCTRETPVIELNCVFLQSTGITQRFL